MYSEVYTDGRSDAYVYVYVYAVMHMGTTAHNWCNNDRIVVNVLTFLLQITVSEDECYLSCAVWKPPCNNLLVA